jgi:uroporphyrinogen-III decarboxylase
MRPEEYADLIRDPTDFWLRVYLPRLFGAFEGFRAIPPLTNIIEMAASQLTILRDPQLRMALRKMLEAGDELEKRMEISEKYAGLGPANGYPSTFGGLSKAPFDILGDALRGTTAIMKDLYRRPDKVLEAVEIIADITIHNITTAPNFSRVFNIMLPLHKGADGWMSQKQFETFYFPTLKKVMDALIKEGMIVTLFAEGSYNTRLESINVFPKGSVCWYFDQTDMVRAKKILGDKCCIQGNVPSSLIVTGSPADVKENCRKLIEGCAPGGGYILTAGCMAENPKLDNLRAMIAAVKEYGVYKK